MTHAYFDIAFTPPVTALQERHGSRSAYARAALHPRGNDRLGAPEAAFIAERDSFYLASTGESGWPYVQFRGGPPGFVRVLSPQQLGWADFRGNQQFITAGNITGDDRVSLFFMDYGGRRRLKVFGRLKYLAPDADPTLAEALTLPDYKARVDRLAIVDVAAWDRNCPQHIPRRYTLAELGLPEDFAVPDVPAESSR
jgi:predicted pyridoxine 5'-phosphate oxidase superfamily flavin-nucleotide-binding protein